VGALCLGGGIVFVVALVSESIVGLLLFLQGFGLGGVIGTFALVIDGIGFVLASSVILVRRGNPAAGR
jgi:hypothetical protein